jgi:ketosteroid isomerase-like protein
MMMSILRSILLIAVAVSLGACCDPPPPQSVDLEAEAEAVLERGQQWNDAVIAKDLDAVMAFYAPEAVQMVAGRPVIEGHDAIRAWFQEWLPVPGIENVFVSDKVEVSIGGTMAVDRGTWKFVMETPEGPVEDFGKYLIVWKKIDGQWFAAADIGHSDKVTAEP